MVRIDIEVVVVIVDVGTDKVDVVGAIMIVEVRIDIEVDVVIVDVGTDELM